MATATEIAQELQRLLGAYPTIKIANPENTAREFISQLQDFELVHLTRAVDEHIRECKWFPQISELRELCRKYKRRGDPVDVDWLAGRLVELEDAWYQDGICEEGEWGKLIEYFERSGRACGAEQARRKFGHIRQQAAMPLKIHVEA